MRLPYVHEVWIAKEPDFKFHRHGIIRTKKRFREDVKAWLLEDPDMRVRFRLVDSPNKTTYEVVDYIPRSGRRGLMFLEVSDQEHLAG